MTGPDPGDADGSTLLEVGRITKAHGLRGEVIVLLSSDRRERVSVGSRLHSDRGTELVVTASRRHHDRWIVQFEGSSSREDADALRGTVLSAAPLEDPDALWVHELIGCVVRSVDGIDRGTVESVMDNPASDLLMLDSGAMVPVAFVLGPPVDGVVHVDTPEGLFEIND